MLRKELFNFSNKRNLKSLVDKQKPILVSVLLFVIGTNLVNFLLFIQEDNNLDANYKTIAYVML